MELNNILQKIEDIKNYQSNKNDNNRNITSDDFRYKNNINKSIDYIAKNYSSVDSELTKKYTDRGIYFDPKKYASGELDRQLADAQSNLAKFGSFLAQTVVSEFTLGTAIVFSDLFDIVTGAVFKNDNDYTNPLTVKLEELQEQFRNEVAPIYIRPGETWSDFGWYMQGLTSLVSSLTLLIPSSLAVKGVSAVGKLGKVAKSTKAGRKWANRLEKSLEDTPKLSTLGKTQLKETSKFITTAALQRTLENYRESRFVFNETYDTAIDKINSLNDEEYKNLIENNKESLKNVDINDKNEVAKAIAKRSADTTFIADYSNIVFDIIQLYGLRNVMFKSFNKNNRISASARRLEKNSRKYAGQYKSIDELKDKIKSAPRKVKIKNKLEDLGYTLGQGLWYEGSEGIEEAINYIASQEGLYVGKRMLDMEKDTTLSKRLSDYWHSPELWENAFWGVVGGIGFTGGANLYSNVKSNIAIKKNAKKEDRDDKTKERKFNTKFNELFESGDSKRLITSIEKRLATENQYAEYIKLLNENKHPINKDENGDNLKITDTEKETLLKAFHSYRRANLILDNIESGTINELRAYMADENVKKDLIEKGIFTKEEADRIQIEDLQAIDEYKETYKQTINDLNNLSKYSKYSGPIEYMQIMARDNIIHKMAIDEYKNEISKIDKELDKITASKVDEEGIFNLSNGIPRYAIELKYFAEQLTALKSDKKKLLNSKDNSISKQQELKALDKEIKHIEKYIKKAYSTSGLLYATYFSETNDIIFDENTNSFIIKNKKSTNPANEQEKIDNKIIEQFEKLLSSSIEDKNPLDTDFLKELSENLDDINWNTINETKVTLDNLLSITNDDFIKNKSEIELIVKNTDNKVKLLQTQSQLITTEKDFTDRAVDLHNYFDAVRRDIINKASDTLTNLALKYKTDNPNTKVVNDNPIRKILQDLYYDNKLDFTGIEDSDKNIIINTLDVLNADNKLNANLLMEIDNIIVEALLLDSATQSNTKTIEPKIEKTKSPVNSILDISEIYHNKEILDDEGNVLYTYKAIKSSKNDSELTPPNYIVRFNEKNPNIIKYLLNDDLFNKIGDIRFDNDNQEKIITLAPVIDNKGNIITKGEIQESNEDTLQLKQGNDEVDNKDIKEYEDFVKSQTDEEEGVVITESSEPDTSFEDDDDGLFTDDTSFENYYEALTEVLSNKVNNISEEDIITNLKNKYPKIKDTTINTIISDANGMLDSLKDDPNSIIRKSTLVEYIVSENKDKSLKDFLKELAYSEIGNRYVIDIDKFIQDITPDLTRELYNKFKNLLRKKITDKDVIVTEENKQSTSFTDTSIIISQNVKTNTLEGNKIQEIINGIKPNDKLIISRDANNIVFTKDGISIGYLPIPEIKTGDTMIQVNDNLITDIKLINGQVVSKLQDLFIELFSNIDKYSELHDIILDYAYNRDDKNKLIEDFKSFCKKNIIDITNFMHNKNAYETTLKGLAKLWKHINISNFSQSQNLENAKTSAINDIKEWFNKVYNSFDIIQKAIKGDYECIITTKTEGELITTDVNEALPSSKALSDIENAVVAANIAGSNRENVNLTFRLDGENNTMPIIKGKYGNTFVAIPNGETYSLVHAYPTKLNNKELSEEFNEIKTEIYKHIETLLKNDNIRDLELFLNSLLKDRSNSFLAPKSTDNTFIQIIDNKTEGGYKTGFTIGIASKEKQLPFLNIFYNDTFYNDRLYSINRQILLINDDNKKELLNMLKSIIENYCTININHSAITGVPYSIVNFTDNKMTISIGDYVKTFDSFNSFILENNLVYLTTKPNNTDGSNFIRHTNDPKTTQQIKIKLVPKENNVTSTVKDNTENTKTNETSFYDSILNLLNDKSNTNKSIELLKLFSTSKDTNLQSLVKKLINNDFKLVDILPKNIIFVDEIKEDNAVTNPTTEFDKESNIPAKTTAVGTKWLNLASSLNPRKQRQAIKVLIHEQLHVLFEEHAVPNISTNKPYDKIKEIFNEFENYVNNNEDKIKEFLKSKGLEENSELITQYLLKDFDDYYTDGTINNKGLEEFLVESLTSNILADFLNTITTSTPIKEDNAKETLFQKIMKFILDLLNINITSGSLYEKEFKLLRDIFNDNSKDSTSNTKSNKKKLGDFIKQSNNRGLRRSNITEIENKTELTISSIDAFVNSFSLDKQKQVLDRIETGNYIISCKL